MGLFGNRQGELSARILALETEVLELRKQVRAALTEVAEVSATAYRHMKAAQARARRQLDDTEGPNQGPRREQAAAVTPAPTPRLWGARARRMSRPDPVHELVDESGGENGVHP